MEELNMQGTDIHNGIIHLDDVIVAWESEKKVGSDYGKMSLEEYIMEVGKYLKVVSDGE